MRSSFYWLLILGVAMVAGCGRSDQREKPESPNSPRVAPRLRSLVRFHFVGTARLAADTNAAPWVSMSALPASETLWRQALEKLSRAPYQFSQHRVATTNDYVSAFQELIADLVRAESFIEAVGDTNLISEAELAVRLPADRAEFWRTNLLTILESWTGCRGELLNAGASGWQLKKHHDPKLLRLVRSGDWTIIGCGQDQLPLQDEYVQRIKQSGSPAAVATGSWMELFCDGPNLPIALSSAFRWPRSPEPSKTRTPNPQPSTLNPQPALNPPSVEFTVSGRDANLRLKGDIKFPEPFSWQLEQWQIPTNLIHDPIISFTAVRGLAPMLKNYQEALGLRFDPIPNQLFVWSGAAFPVGTLAAMPVNDAAETLRNLAPRLLGYFNPELEALNAGALVITTNLSGRVAVRWTDIPPFISPFLSAEQDSDGNFLFAGIFPNWGGTNAPPVLLHYLASRTNLIYYDWEITGEHVWAWRHVINIFRHMLERPRLAPDTASIVWINSISNRLGNTITEVTRSDSNRLSFVRQGPVGFTGLELIALAHWLESTNFPLNGFTLPPRTNAPTAR